jgi:hypothetical protein
MSNLREPGSFKNTQVVPQPRDALRERTGSFLPTRPAGAGALEGTKAATSHHTPKESACAQDALAGELIDPSRPKELSLGGRVDT